LNWTCAGRQDVRGLFGAVRQALSRSVQKGPKGSRPRCKTIRACCETGLHPPQRTLLMDRHRRARSRRPSCRRARSTCSLYEPTSQPGPRRAAYSSTDRCRSMTREIACARSSEFGGRTSQERKRAWSATASRRRSMLSSLTGRSSSRSIASAAVRSNTAMVPEEREVGRSSATVGKATRRSPPKEAGASCRARRSSRPPRTVRSRDVASASGTLGIC